MWVDIIGLIVIASFFFRGYSKGLIVAAFSVLSLLLGIICALKLSQSLAQWLLENHYVSSAWAQIVSYIVLFIAVVMIVRMVGRMVEKAAEGLLLGTVNKLAGGMLYGFMGAVIWSSLLWIGAHSGILAPDAIAASRTYGPLSSLAPWFFEQAGRLLPFARNTFSGLEHYFDTLNGGHVGAHR